MQSELLKIEELNITEAEEAHIFHLSGLYGSALAKQVVQTLLTAVEVDRLNYAFTQVEDHFQAHLKRVPHPFRGLARNSRGANPSQMFLHRLKEELAPASNLSAA